MVKRFASSAALAAVALLCVVPAQAQTADEIVEKHLAATGGREAWTKLESRIAKGSVLISMQGADIAGPVEMYHKAPNKTRVHFRLDLTPYGGDEVVIEQRCDGKTAYQSNSMQGDQEITGARLQGMLNATFPTPLLNYKQAGATIELTGKEMVGDREAYVLLYTPKAGPPSTHYFDTKDYLELRSVTRMDIPELGGETNQTTDDMDYRDVDGVKIPFAVKIVNSMQTITIKLDSVEHNKPIDEAMFSRPAVK
jgi:hypothetical protein